MTRYRAVIAYDGSAFFGYQIQSKFRTVQGTLEATLTELFGTLTTVFGAGRTDTGVHATGQVIAFDATWKHDMHSLQRMINHSLPEDISVLSIEEQAGFHPRFGALSRMYRYDVAVSPVRNPLFGRYSWQISDSLDVSLLNEAANVLLGKHDFATFGKPPKGTNTTREVFHSSWVLREAQFGQVYSYTVEATAFLQHMVRRMVWMLVDVGRGRSTVAEFEKAFRLANLKYAEKLAPPEGLVLVKVRYPLPDL